QSWTPRAGVSPKVARSGSKWLEVARRWLEVARRWLEGAPKPGRSWLEAGLKLAEVGAVPAPDGVRAPLIDEENGVLKGPGSQRMTPGLMSGPQTVAVLDAFGGLAGDMFLGALLDLGREEVDATSLEAALRSLALPGWTMRVAPAERRHLGCTKIDFDVADERDHRHLPEIVAIIEGSQLPERAKQRALGAF